MSAAAQEQLPLGDLGEPVGPVAVTRAMPASRADCQAIHMIERRAVLVCNWSAGHEGERHWDQGDDVIWQASSSWKGSRP